MAFGEIRRNWGGAGLGSLSQMKVCLSTALKSVCLLKTLIPLPHCQTSRETAQDFAVFNELPTWF